MIEPGLHLHFDGAAGAAGDMVLGALLDLGVPRALLEEAFDRVGIGRQRLRVERVVKGGIAAVDVKIDAGSERHGREPHGSHDHPGDHDHDHPGEHDHHHDHVAYRDVVRRIEGSGLEPETARRALDIFARLGRAEAKLHDRSIEDVAFHEVGAIDSIADVVGAAAALAHLAPGSVSAAPIAMGHGQVRSAHGVLPVPSPAALEILREVGAPVLDGGVARELCTPTGAAILAHAVTVWGAPSPLCPLAIGYGAGDAELSDRPNVLRALLGRPTAGAATEALYRIEANLDDMSPEVCAHAAEVIAQTGALDVWWTPITMKKSRPAVLLGALVPPAALDAVLRAVLTETTSLGVRFEAVSRLALAREEVLVETRFGRLPVKVGLLDGRPVNAAPEFEPCRAAARKHGVPLKDVFAAVIAAWHQRT